MTLSSRDREKLYDAEAAKAGKPGQPPPLMIGGDGYVGMAIISGLVSLCVLYALAVFS